MLPIPLGLNNFCLILLCQQPLPCTWCTLYAGVILCMGSANERWRYIVMSSLIGRAHAQNEPCLNQSVYGVSQWEMTLHCNVISHWQNPCTEWPLQCYVSNSCCQATSPRNVIFESHITATKYIMACTRLISSAKTNLETHLPSTTT